MESSIIQTFLLPAGEKLVGMFQHSEAVESVVVDSNIGNNSAGVLQSVDGVFLVTSSGLYCCQPKTSPEKLFLELAVNSTDTSAADILAITSGLDVNKLYEMAGDQALMSKNYKRALELYHLSKCPFEKQVSQFAKHERVADILGHLRQVLSKHGDVHTAERKQLSNLTLMCFIQQVLNSSGDAIKYSELSDAFSQFLNDNFDYDEVTALEQLAAYGLKGFMFDLAKARGVMERALEILAQKGQFHLSLELQTKLASRGFTDIVSRSARGAFIQCMDPCDAVAFLLSKPETILSHIKFFLSRLTSLNEESLVHISRVLDPSRPSFRSLANQTRPLRKRSASTTSISSMISLESTVSFGQVSIPRIFIVMIFQITCFDDEDLCRINVLSVACGMEHTLALCWDGVYSWGSSQYGQLGQGDTQQQTRPVYVTELSDKKCIAVACGHYHSLALSVDHRVWSWGWGVHGQLGVGSIEDVLLPTHIAGLDEFEITQLAAGYSHSAVLSAKGQVFTFGGGLYGQLGLGTNCKQVVPQLVESLAKERVYLICCGSFETLAVTEGQKIFNWGRSPHFFRFYMRQEHRAKRSTQANVPMSSLSHRLLPVKIDCLFSSRINDVCCGNCHYLVLLESGQLYSWGFNDYGQLGLGNKMDSPMTPRLIHKLANKHIMSISMLNFWLKNGLSSERLESFVLEYVGILGYPLSLLLFRDRHFSPTSEQNHNEALTMFSASFLKNVVTHVVNQLQEEEMGEEYASDLRSVLAMVHSPTEISTLDDKSSLQQPFAQLDAGIQKREFHAAQSHMWQEILDNIKKDLDRHPCIALSTTAAATVASAAVSQQRGWREGDSVSEFQHDVVLFTCNHHFPRVYFQEFILPEFQQRMSELTLELKHTTKLLLKYYNMEEGCLPAACPICVYNSIRIEQFELLVEQNASAENVQARPWDICYGYIVNSKRIHYFWGLLRDRHFSPTSEQNHNEALTMFSASFLKNVVTHVVNQLQEEEMGEEYASDLRSVLAMVHSPTEISTLDDKSSLQQPFAQLDAGIQKREFHAAQSHMWQEILDNIKKDLDRHPCIALSTTAAATVASAAVSQQRGWREGDSVSEFQNDVVLFTCNHHFPRVYFQEFILPEFQQRMSELTLELKHTTKLLLKYYNMEEGCLPAACPICVYNSIRIEQFELLVEQNASAENVQARPWDI
ncbi:PREDICTED: uncharacterized protein LOC107341105 [Acropora digitifera]|uniref:uncharacterized protein LOC107341105 n=1 Tax=Acropora digitifera TaxID=70779 RepID=UPI00077A0969|nr:PREDICTED: uncharacterized protein LOC107341105 [Acropora digitifera]